MNICLVNFAFFPQIGGTEHLMYELARALIERGHEVHVLAPLKLFKEYQEIDGIKVHGIQQEFLSTIANTIGFAPDFAEFLTSLSEKYNLHVIHSQLWRMFTLNGAILLLKRKIDIASVLTLHSLSLGEFSIVPSFDSDLLGFSKLFLRKPPYDLILSVCKDVAQRAVKLGVSANLVKVVYTGVNVRRFNPRVDGSSLRERLSVDENDPLIVCPARTDPRKGLEYLVRAFVGVVKEFRRAKLLIPGGDSAQVYYERAIRNLIRSLSLQKNILFRNPRYRYDEMPKLYSASDLVVLSSIDEGLSLALLEGMATGKPVIATNVGGASEVIDNGVNGVLVPPANTRQLSRSMLKLINDTSLAKQIGSNARRLVEEKFTTEKMVRNTAKAYQNVINEID